MKLRRSFAGLTVSFVLLTAPPAFGQQNAATLVGPIDPRPGMEISVPRHVEFRVPEGDLRRAGQPRRNGLIAAYPIDENLEVGLGRFLVPEIARPRTHMESERNPTAVRFRDRGIAAVGFIHRF